MNALDLLFLLLGLALGAAIAWLWAQQSFVRERAAWQSSTQQADQEALLARKLAEERLSLTEKSMADHRDELLKLRQENLRLSAENAQHQTALGHARQQVADKEAELLQTQQKLAAEFKNIANEILEEKSRRFTELNREQVGNVLQPLHRQLAEFKQKVEEVYEKEAKQRFSLEREIRQLHDLNQQMSKEAHQLTTALRGQAKTQGNWGEVILENVLENSGLTRDHEYLVQQSYTDETGRRLQPDVVIKLPQQRYMVIDAKVSLNAYERYAAAQTDEERATHLDQHLKSVRQHINDLSGKNYQQLHGAASPDFVLLFMPVEPAFHLAMQHDQSLFQWAFDRNIVLVSVSTLLATLRTVASIWRQEKQSRNAEEIAKEGGALYDKLVGLLADLQTLGKELATAQKAYDGALNKLSTGKGNLLARAEKMKALGAKATKSLPPEFDPEM